MEYRGYDIYVHGEWVVLGDDPYAEAVRGYVAQIRRRDPETSPDGDPVWDYPFGTASSELTGTTEAEVVEKAKAFIDTHERRPSV